MLLFYMEEVVFIGPARGKVKVLDHGFDFWGAITHISYTICESYRSYLVYNVTLTVGKGFGEQRSYLVYTVHILMFSNYNRARECKLSLIIIVMSP